MLIDVSLCMYYTYMQEDRERLIIRRFKFEELRFEQIQELEVGLFITFSFPLQIPLFSFELDCSTIIFFLHSCRMMLSSILERICRGGF